jgi:sulfotransferase family protein
MVSRSTLPPAMKRVVHIGSRTVGRLTAGARMLPSFLICGGQRCGTTSMHRALNQHPAILKAVLHKGVHYFDTEYAHSLAWYRGHFPLRYTARRVQRRVGVAPVTFESSPYYMYHPLAGARIATDLPGVKLLALVRDPVERAYSQHAHEVARGYEVETDFVRALALEEERTAGEAARLAADPRYRSHSHQHHAYRARGQYADYLERLADFVDRDRILVVDSHEFFATPEPVYARVLDFLGLPAAGNPVFERHNARPRPAPMPEPVRSDLDRHFAPYDKRLIDWLGRDPSWRRS